MCVCTYMCVCTCIHEFELPQTGMRAYTLEYLCMAVYTHVLYVCIYMCVCTCIYSLELSETGMCTCALEYVYVHIKYIHICVYAHT
jgi:hypothetical protein